MNLRESLQVLVPHDGFGEVRDEDELRVRDTGCFPRSARKRARRGKINPRAAVDVYEEVVPNDSLAVHLVHSPRDEVRRALSEGVRERQRVGERRRGSDSSLTLVEELVSQMLIRFCGTKRRNREKEANLDKVVPRAVFAGHGSLAVRKESAERFEEVAPDLLSEHIRVSLFKFTQLSAPYLSRATNESETYPKSPPGGSRRKTTPGLTQGNTCHRSSTSAKAQEKHGPPSFARRGNKRRETLTRVRRTPSGSPRFLDWPLSCRST